MYAHRGFDPDFTVECNNYGPYDCYDRNKNNEYDYDSDEDYEGVSIRGLLSDTMLKLLKYLLRKLPYMVVLYIVSHIMWKTHKKLKSIKKGKNPSELNPVYEDDV